MSIEIDYLSTVPLQEKNLWEFYITPSLTSISGGVDDFRFKTRVQSISLPFEMLEVERLANHRNYYKGVKPVDDIEITFLETVDFKTLKYLELWKNETYNTESDFFYSGEHRRNGILILQSHLFNFLPPVATKGYEFRRMRILGIGNIEFNYEGGENLVISASFSVDKVMPIKSLEEISQKLFLQDFKLY